MLAALLYNDFVSSTVIKRIGQQHFYTKILLAALLYLLRFCQQHYAALLYKAFVSSTVIQRFCQQHCYTKILSAALVYKDFVSSTKQHCYTKALSAAMLSKATTYTVPECCKYKGIVSSNVIIKTKNIFYTNDFLALQFYKGFVISIVMQNSSTIKSHEANVTVLCLVR